MMKSLVNGMRAIYKCVYLNPIVSTIPPQLYILISSIELPSHCKLITSIKSPPCFAQLSAPQLCVPYSSRPPASQAPAQTQNHHKQKPNHPNRRNPKTKRNLLPKRKPWPSWTRSFARKCLASQGMEERLVSSWRVARYIESMDKKCIIWDSVTDFLLFQPVSMKRSVRENMFRYI